MHVRPLTSSALVDHLVEVIGQRRTAAGEQRLRVVVDGAPSTRPGALADALVDPLRAAGTAVVRVSADDFLRPASLRFEHGRRDPWAYYEDRLDLPALAREVVDPFGGSGPASYLPTLWDAERERATRAPYEPVPPGAVLLLDGCLLLGRWLDLDLTVHLTQRPETLGRLTPVDEQWVLPAFARYEDEVSPQDVADVVVRLDDVRRPALVVTS